MTRLTLLDEEILVIFDIQAHLREIVDSQHE